MRLSAIIPAYNAAEYICQTLDSIHAQTRRPDEVIVCDDGSTDATADLATAHPLAPTVLRCENGGVARARNTAIEASSGDLVANIDADDIWHPEYLQRMEEALAANPDATAAFSRYRTFLDEDGPPAWSPRDTADTGVKRLALAEFLAFEQRGMPVLPSYHVMRRTALDQLQPHPYREDHVCGETLAVVPILAAMGPTLQLPAILGQYRMHSGSITSTELRTARWMVRVAREMAQRAQTLGFDRESLHEIRRYAGYWSVKSGRRLGGGGFRGEGRRAIFTGFRQGRDPRALAVFFASVVPGLGSRVWRRQWRADSARR